MQLGARRIQAIADTMDYYDKLFGNHGAAAVSWQVIKGLFTMNRIEAELSGNHNELDSSA